MLLLACEVVRDSIILIRALVRGRSIDNKGAGSIEGGKA